MTRCSKSRKGVAADVARAALARALAGALLVGCFSAPGAAQQVWDTTVVAPAPVKPAPLPGAPATVPVPRLKPAPLPVLQTGSVPAQAPAAERKPVPESPAQVAARPRKSEPASAEARPAQNYCVNIADAAVDARFAWQRKTLAEIEKELSKRVALLEEKTAEYQKWLARRDEFSKKAQDSLLSIYARMRPDAAALQLALLDEETAAALLIKLDPRNASAILSEMEPSQAARLSATIGGAAKINPTAPSKAPAADNKS